MTDTLIQLILCVSIFLSNSCAFFVNRYLNNLEETRLKLKTFLQKFDTMYLLKKDGFMKNILLSILEKYLQIFPEEYERQLKLIEYLNNHEDDSITDWNNFDGHIVAGGFVYAKAENKFLVLYHKDLQMYLYPGGHIDSNDKNPLEASRREIKEETGLQDLEQLKLADEVLIPIDIDTHEIGHNQRLKLPPHYHFDFRYLFTVDKIEDIKMDTEELANFQWIDIVELSKDQNYGKVASKIERLLSEVKTLKR